MLSSFPISILLSSTLLLFTTHAGNVLNIGSIRIPNTISAKGYSVDGVVPSWEKQSDTVSCDIKNSTYGLSDQETLSLPAQLALHCEWDLHYKDLVTPEELTVWLQQPESRNPKQDGFNLIFDSRQA